MEETVLAKVKRPDDSGEERFCFVTMDLQAGKMVRMSEGLTEAQVRARLAGMPEAELDSKIANAREHPA
jgi:hypothetical protein